MKRPVYAARCGTLSPVTRIAGSRKRRRGSEAALKPLPTWQMWLLTMFVYLPIVVVFVAGGWTAVAVRAVMRRLR